MATAVPINVDLAILNDLPTPMLSLADAVLTVAESRETLGSLAFKRPRGFPY